ncbi:MAG: FtsX-like permease family protein [Bacteroidota bacterium]
MQTYIRKAPATTVASINSSLEAIVEKHVGKEIEQGLGITFAEFRKQGGIYSYFAYSLTDSHLKSDLQEQIEPGGNIQYIYIFVAVGIFILVIACINFMNLSTARSANRAKEVGLRKTLGSGRSQMVFQFLAESVVYSLISVALAVIVCYLLLPQFNLLSGKSLTFGLLVKSFLLATLAGIVLFIGLVAGSYPAFYLTSFNAVEVLKGKVRAGLNSKGVRSTLVVLQFSISTFLIISTVVVYRQLQFMQSKDMGLDQHNIITINNTRRLGTNAEAFKNALEELAQVKGASFTSNALPGVDNTTVFRQQGSEQDRLMALYYTDWDHAAVMKITVKEGRFFSRNFASDTTACVINEAAQRELALDAPLNTELTDFQGTTPEKIRIIGVVADFNFESLKNNVRPLVIRLSPSTRRNLMIRYEGSASEMVAAVAANWKKYASGEPLEYPFSRSGFRQPVPRGATLKHAVFGADYAGYFYCLFGVVCAGCFYGRTAHQGNWHS